MQCFVNEYVYNECDEELEALKNLEKSTQLLLNAGEQPHQLLLRVLRAISR